MILYESAKTRHRKIHGRIPERLPKLINIARQEIAERSKEIYAVEAVRYVRSQSHAIGRRADLPTMFSSHAGVRIAGLIVVFAAFAVSCIRQADF